MRSIKLVIFLHFLTLNSSLAIIFNCQYITPDTCTHSCNQCKALNLIITKPHQVVTKTFGYNGNTKDAKIIKIHDQVVHYLPHRLDTFFPHVTVLQIWSCGLRSLAQSDLKAFPHLTELSVSGNELESLPSDLFEFTQRLVKIDFSRNRLRHVGYNLIGSIPNLVVADFYQNDCVSDGSRRSIAHLIENLRKKCRPTVEMLIDDVTRVNGNVERLEGEVRTCERIQRSRRCDDGGDTMLALDSLFPSVFVNNRNNVNENL